MGKKLQVTLNDWQKEVFIDGHRFKVICAGRRSGKSTLAQYIVLSWAIKEVGTYYIVNPTYKQAKSIHWKDLRGTIPREWIAKKNETELSFTLKNGSVIELKGAENPDALRGVKLRGLVIDEIASIRNWEWLWQEVLRPTLTDYSAPAIFISTPKGYNHFYDLFQAGQQKEMEDYKSWRFTSYDNPYIPKEEIDNAKAELTEDTFAQEYLADFRKFTGLVYKEFDREAHIVEPFDIPDSYYLYRAFDFGSTNPTVCLWIAVDGDDNWFVVDEHYETGKTIDYHAGIVNSSKYRDIQATYGDPSGAQIITEFAQRGIYITPANKETGTNYNSWVRFGIEKVAEKLKRVPGHLVQFTNGNSRQGTASLFIFSSCVNTIREFETYRWKEKSVSQAQDLNEPDVPEKANDHAMDALRYFACSYNKKAEEIELPDDTVMFKEGFY
jgi:hypothetical protein